MRGWRTTKLGELLDFANGRSSPERSSGLPFPVYGSNGIIGHASQVNAGPGTIIIGRVGSYCGSLYFTKDPCWVTDNAIKATARDDNDSSYLFYLLRTLGLNNLRAGSGQPLLNQEILAGIPVCVAPARDQPAIAAVLAALDKKISINREMNETLEAVSQEIFRDWFVDFGPTSAKFAGREPYLSPDLWLHFPTNFDGDKPKGWVIFKLADLAVQHTESINPQEAPDSEFEHFSLPSYDAGQLPAIDLGRTIKSNKTKVPRGAVLLSKLNPEIRRVWLPDTADGRAQICSTEFLAMTPTAASNRQLLYGLFNEFGFRKRLESMVTGTSKSHQRISPPGLMNSDVLIGSKDSFALYAAVTEVPIRKLVANRTESRVLTATRDFLLPRLMSGNISIRGAEKFSEGEM